MAEFAGNDEIADILEIPEFTSISQEAKYLGRRLLSHDLIEIFTGNRQGTAQQQEKLQAIWSQLGNGIYVEIVYSLTHTLVRDKEEARKIYEEIIAHRAMITRMLNRQISVEVAALDYLQGVRNMLKEPTIIEARKCDSFAYLSIMDDTTQVYDKGLLDTDLDAEIERSRRFGVPFSVLFIDIDNLKTVNDTYGHELGTKAIQFVTECIKQNLRKYDSIYRYGGDEFVVLLARADSNQAQVIANRIIELIQDGRIEGLAAPPGVSIGIASRDTNTVCDKQSLLSAADTALYRAKDRGKNRICVYEEQEAHRILCQQTHTRAGKRRLVIKGLALVEGIGMGRSYIYRDVLSRETAIFDILPGQVESEMERVRKAIQKTQRYIGRIQKAIAHLAQNTSEGIHSTIIEPETILKEIEDELKRKLINVEQVVRSVFHQIERRFRSCRGGTVRQHAADVAELGNRILRMLTGSQENPLAEMSTDTIIFSHRLMPCDTVHFENSPPAAIITQEGGGGSHAATIAKAKEIPLVSRLPVNIDDIPQQVPVIVDGYKGVVVFNPTTEEMEEYRLQKEALESKRQVFVSNARNIPLMVDGVPVRIHALAWGPEDIKTGLDNGCDDIGLYRVESLFMRSPMLPSEGDLFNSIHQALLPAGHKEVTLQLPDLGGDRYLPYIHQQEQRNPALGLRGARFLIRYPIILETMLRVIIRLSAHFNIRIVIPTVTLPDDLEIIRDKLKAEMARLEKEKVRFNEAIAVGAMIQTPGSVFILDQIIRCSDFLSIDSGDLIQYTMIADRQNLQVADYYDRGSHLALNMVHAIMQKTQSNQMGCTLCGKLAGDMRYTEFLLSSGLVEFGVLPTLIPDMKESIRHIIRKD
ncbi:MAG: putative PEP-binding protein [Chitinispirillaceae bacterium]